MHLSQISSLLIGLGIILFCLILSAFFAMTEAAVLSISNLKAKHLQDEKGKDAEILNLWIKKPSLILVALLISNNLINIFAAVYTDAMTRRLFGKSSIVVVSIVMTFIIVLFSEVIPKTFAKNFANEVVIPLLKIFKYFYYLLLPISHFMTYISNTIQGWIFTKAINHPPITKEELQFFIHVSEQEGVIPEQKHEMLSGIFEMSKTIVREIMVPRPDISALSSKTKITNSIDQFKETGFSRLPIYEDRIDNIIGIVHVKDALFFMKKHQNSPAELREKSTVMDIKRDVMFFPETKPIDQLFQEMRRQKQHFAVVVDEYGGTSGIVTMEDIFEEIVGEVRDEYDKEEESIHPTQNPHQFITDCKIHIDDFAEFFDLNLRHIREKYPQDFDTLAGLILHHFGRLPKLHDKLSLANLDLEILEISKRRVRKVLVTIQNNHKIETS